MQVSDITKEDAVAVAQIFHALKAGKFEVSGTDLQALAASLRWLQNLSTQMQQVLRTSGVAANKSPAGDGPIKIKPSPVSAIKSSRGPKGKK